MTERDINYEKGRGKKARWLRQKRYETTEMKIIWTEGEIRSSGNVNQTEK